jgi:hypothetical protein
MHLASHHACRVFRYAADRNHAPDANHQATSSDCLHAQKKPIAAIPLGILAQTRMPHNAPDQKRGEISALHPAYAPVFCIWLLCAWQYLVSGADDRENPLDLHDDWRNIATIKQAD